jgi:hypothetical protein
MGKSLVAKWEEAGDSRRGPWTNGFHGKKVHLSKEKGNRCKAGF